MSDRVVVVGAGIAGLAAAHRVRERAPATEVVVLDAAPRAGGTIATEEVDGFRIEIGADSFLTEKPWARALAERLGFADRLISTREGERRTLVLHDGRLHALPEGFLLLAPTSLGPLLRSGLFSWRGKVRMGLDLVLPRRRSTDDESLASFVRRRLGEEALVRVADALVGGIYTADPETLSLAATMPRFLAMEHDFGSVIRGLRRRASGEEASAAGARYGMFASHERGMGGFIDDLVRRLPEGALRTGTWVASIEHTGERWRIDVGGQPLDARHLVLAVPAFRAAALLGGVDAELSARLAAIHYASSVTVTLGFRAADVAERLRGFGFVVPHAEGRELIACTFASRKYAGRAPADHELLRAFVGGARRPEMVHLSDEELLGRVLDDLRDILGITAVPMLTRVQRWERAMPQYTVGHLDRVDEIERRVRTLPGLRLAGGAYRGVGIPDCIHSGERAIDELLGA